MKDIIRKILKESFEDDLDWIRDTEPNYTIDFFIPGKEYKMDVLHKNNPSGYVIFKFYSSDGMGQTYEDGRGLLVFGKLGGQYHSYTPLYIETRLKDLGLTLYDLEVAE